MSRLLFAAARGARIGWEHAGEWYSAMSMCIGPSKADNGTIHPDDAHLQYGPISTALREMAEEPPRTTDAIWPVERNYLNVYKYSDEMYMWADDLHKSLMLLLVAETLADEGM